MGTRGINGAVLCLLAASACNTDLERTCSAYCVSELECGAIDRQGMADCVAVCREQLADSSDSCAASFRVYAECYDDSTSCNAADCFSSFAQFAGACAWHQDEVALSSGEINHGRKGPTGG